MKSISISKLDKYYNLTFTALNIARGSVVKGKEHQAKEILTTAECYLSDAKHFQKKKDFVNAFACLNYAHGWLDAGARLKIFNVNDNHLFSV